MNFNLIKVFAFVGLVSLSNHSQSFDPANSSMELSREVITTITEVVINQSETGELVDATVYANNDNRIIQIDGALVSEIRDLMDAKKNGWEVKLSLELSIDKEVGGVFNVLGVEILSRENKLSTGILSTPRTPFKPIVAKSAQELNEMFSAMYPYSSNYYDVSDDCFNRAHYWSRTQQHLQNLNGIEKGTEKVFIFFSRAYTSKFNHKWWYHVAPVLYLNNKSNPHVFDPTFISRPVTLAQWLGSFDGHTNGECVKINSLEDYYAKSNQPICMYMVVPMYNYAPSDLARGARLSNWRCNDFNRVRSFSAPGSNTTNRNARWSDSEFSYLTPQDCR
jgi:hypothetical protein